MRSNAETFLEWVLKASDIVDQYLELMSPYVIESPSPNPQLQWILKYLAISCNQSTISILTLIANEHLWDAEILLRSVIEGTIKYAYLCVGDENNRKQKSEEYLIDLPSIADIKHHYRITSFLQNLEDVYHNDYDILKSGLLSDSELEQLQKQYPRSIRQNFEQKWSFNEIISALSKSDDGLKHFDAMRFLLAYSYGLGSHLSHQDAFGLKMIHQRLQITPEESISAQRAHAARQINDLIMMSLFRTSMTYLLHKDSSVDALDLLQSHKPFLEELSRERDKWWANYYQNGKITKD